MSGLGLTPAQQVLKLSSESFVRSVVHDGTRRDAFKLFRRRYVLCAIACRLYYLGSSSSRHASQKSLVCLVPYSISFNLDCAQLGMLRSWPGRVTLLDGDCRRVVAQGAREGGQGESSFASRRDARGALVLDDVITDIAAAFVQLDNILPDALLCHQEGGGHEARERLTVCQVLVCDRVAAAARPDPWP